MAVREPLYREGWFVWLPTKEHEMGAWLAQFHGPEAVYAAKALACVLRYDTWFGRKNAGYDHRPKMVAYPVVPSIVAAVALIVAGFFGHYRLGEYGLFGQIVGHVLMLIIMAPFLAAFVAEPIVGVRDMVRDGRRLDEWAARTAQVLGLPDPTGMRINTDEAIRFVIEHSRVPIETVPHEILHPDNPA